MLWKRSFLCIFSLVVILHHSKRVCVCVQDRETNRIDAKYSCGPGVNLLEFYQTGDYTTTFSMQAVGSNSDLSLEDFLPLIFS